ncbi:MAG: HEAT repeat domain-containing protein [Bacteroidetes bacterium]|nr:HEAT repeat domain-containing protein [Bacteroidota bacterium]
MKTNQRLLARATSILCLTALLWIPQADAQSLSFDAQLAFADGAHNADHDAAWRAELPVDPAEDAFAASIDALRRSAPVMSKTDWKTYGEGLQDALAFEHQGLRNSALRLFIAYSERLQLGNEAVVDLMRIYRDDDSEQARRMAVVALGELDSALAVDYLERSLEFEESDAVKRTIAAVVNSHRAA